LGRVIRTITLRYLSEPGLRDQIAAVANRTEAFHDFSQFLMIGGRLIGHNDPEYQGRVVELNELVDQFTMLCSVFEGDRKAGDLSVPRARSPGLRDVR